MRVGNFAPRALLHRRLILVELTPSEHHKLIQLLEAEAEQAIADGLDDFADFVLRRIAELREAGR